jgi:hypothetical protein
VIRRTIPVQPNKNAQSPFETSSKGLLNGSPFTRVRQPKIQRTFFDTTVISGCISLMYLCFWAAPRHAADNGAPILNGIWFGLGRFTKRALSGPRIGGIAGLRRECSQRAEINCSCLKTGCCARCATAGLRQQRAGRRDQDAARNKSKSRLTCHAVANAQ